MSSQATNVSSRSAPHRARSSLGFSMAWPGTCQPSLGLDGDGARVLCRSVGTFLPGLAGHWLMTRDMGGCERGLVVGRTGHLDPQGEAMSAEGVHPNGVRPVPHRTGPDRADDIVRVGVLGSLLCGVLTTVHEVWEDNLPGIQQGVGWSLLHTAWLAAMFRGDPRGHCGPAWRAGPVRQGRNAYCAGRHGGSDGDGGDRGGYIDRDDPVRR